MTTVAIVDYGSCNLDSMARAVQQCGGSPVVTDQPTDLRAADRIILPGVGAFAVAAERLRSTGLAEAVVEQVTRDGIPLLAVCLGMQLLADSSEEGPGAVGLGLVPGRVRRLPVGQDERVPHVGWNEVWRRHDPAVLEGVPDGSDFYFVHSYHLEPADDSWIVGTTPYAGDFVSVVSRDHVVGAQFHPEKSQRAGLQLVANFLEL